MAWDSFELDPDAGVGHLMTQVSHEGEAGQLPYRGTSALAYAQLAHLGQEQVF
jgi:hypothetical protein